MKTALVTGANKGIGREVAYQLAKQGFHVFIGARNRSAGRKTAEESSGMEATPHSWELTSTTMKASPERRVISPKL